MGGVITNLLSRELLEQIGSFDLWYEQSDSLIQNLKKRLGQFMMVCLGGMTGFQESGFIWFFWLWEQEQVYGRQHSGNRRCRPSFFFQIKDIRIQHGSGNPGYIRDPLFLQIFF